MNQTILLIISVVVIVILLIPKTREKITGICVSTLDQTVRKNANKEKILAFIREKGEVSNEEIREHLKVSPRSVVRYLNELEKGGKVEQVGDIGRGVIYRLK